MALVRPVGRPGGRGAVRHHRPGARRGGVPLSGLAGYIFASGPGSVLGLRTAAMALRTWGATPGLAAKPVLAVNSLQLAGALAKASGLGDATVFAASRRDRWNAWALTASQWEECDAAALAALPNPTCVCRRATSRRRRCPRRLLIRSPHWAVTRKSSKSPACSSPPTRRTPQASRTNTSPGRRQAQGLADQIRILSTDGHRFPQMKEVVWFEKFTTVRQRDSKPPPSHPYLNLRLSP